MGGCVWVCVYVCVYIGSGEMKYKLYGSVLVIGGGLSFPGAAAMLQARLELQQPKLINRSSHLVEVFSNPRVCMDSTDEIVFTNKHTYV